MYPIHKYIAAYTQNLLAAGTYIGKIAGAVRENSVLKDYNRKIIDDVHAGRAGICFCSFYFGKAESDKIIIYVSL
jgi:hypothetical protein